MLGIFFDRLSSIIRFQDTIPIDESEFLVLVGKPLYSIRLYRVHARNFDPVEKWIMIYYKTRMEMTEWYPTYTSGNWQ